MKHILRLLTLAAVGAIGMALFSMSPRQQEEAAPITPIGGGPSDQLLLWQMANIPINQAGDRLLLTAIARLEQRGSITARIRQTAQIGDLPFFGAGTYRQQGRGSRRQVRWLLQSQRDGVSATLLQVSDGRFLWTDYNLASGRRIERVDLWQLRREAVVPDGPELADQSLAASAGFISPQLGASFGGMQMLLESLREHFEFAAPRLFSFDGQPMYALLGRWREETLATIVTQPDQMPENISEDTAKNTEEKRSSASELRARLRQHLADHTLPERMPHHVLVLLGEQDLFPYLIDYRGQADPLANPQLAIEQLYRLSAQPLARLELLEIDFDQPIDNREFLYTPPEEPEWLDTTATYVKRLSRIRKVQSALARERHLATLSNSATLPNSANAPWR